MHTQSENQNLLVPGQTVSRLTRLPPSTNNMAGFEPILDATGLLILHIRRVGQNRIYTPYMTVYLIESLPKIPYIHRIYMAMANPTYTVYAYAHIHRTRVHM
jgi:hypothetical protein